MKPVMLKILRLAVLLLCLPSITLAQNATNTVLVTQEYRIFEMGWAHGAGKLFVAWNIYNVGGRIAVCGAVRHSSNAVSRQNSEILRRGWVKHGSRKVIKDLRFFNDNGFTASFVGAQARCKLTSVPANSGGVQLGFDPGRARF